MKAPRKRRRNLPPSTFKLIYDSDSSNPPDEDSEDESECRVRISSCDIDGVIVPITRLDVTGTVCLQSNTRVTRPLPQFRYCATLARNVWVCVGSVEGHEEWFERIRPQDIITFFYNEAIRNPGSMLPPVMHEAKTALDMHYKSAAFREKDFNRLMGLVYPDRLQWYIVSFGTKATPGNVLPLFVMGEDRSAISRKKPVLLHFAENLIPTGPGDDIVVMKEVSSDKWAYCSKESRSHLLSGTFKTRYFSPRSRNGGLVISKPGWKVQVGSASAGCHTKGYYPFRHFKLLDIFKKFACEYPLSKTTHAFGPIPEVPPGKGTVPPSVHVFPYEKVERELAFLKQHLADYLMFRPQLRIEHTVRLFPVDFRGGAMSLRDVVHSIQQPIKEDTLHSFQYDLKPKALYAFEVVDRFMNLAEFLWLAKRRLLAETDFLKKLRLFGKMILSRLYLQAAYDGAGYNRGLYHYELLFGIRQSILEMPSTTQVNEAFLESFLDYPEIMDAIINYLCYHRTRYHDALRCVLDKRISANLRTLTEASKQARTILERKAYRRSVAKRALARWNQLFCGVLKKRFQVVFGSLRSIVLALDLLNSGITCAIKTRLPVVYGHLFAVVCYPEIEPTRQARVLMEGQAFLKARQFDWEAFAACSDLVRHEVEEDEVVTALQGGGQRRLWDSIQLKAQQGVARVAREQAELARQRVEIEKRRAEAEEERLRVLEQKKAEEAEAVRERKQAEGVQPKKRKRGRPKGKKKKKRGRKRKAVATDKHRNSKAGRRRERQRKKQEGQLQPRAAAQGRQKRRKVSESSEIVIGGDPE